MKVVAIKKMSNGNESVGEMWHETKIFELDTPVKKILLWAGGGYLTTTKDILLTVAEEAPTAEQEE